MTILQIIAGVLIGTSLMTLFSYVVSRKKEKQFREPQLLNELVLKLKISINPSQISLLGWFLHFLTGVGFTLVMYFFWLLTGFQPSLLSGIILGAVLGLVGIVTWFTIFSIHPDPPDIKLEKYLGHLLIAHIIFGFGVALGFLLIA